MTDRLVFGAAQLGMPYGISNKVGKPDFSNACEIVKTVFDQGIIRFDTAQAYGDSEEVLGRAFDRFELNSRVKVYSKLHPELDLRDEKKIWQSVEDSLVKLKIGRLEGLLLHHEDKIRLWNEGLGDALRGLVVKDKVKFIGASFYSPQKALEALDIDGIDIIQVPANIFDQRFENAGVFKKAQENGKKVFVRSIFLQGLLLIPLDCLPASMQEVLPYLIRLEQMASSMKLSRQELVLGYARQKWFGSLVLFGAENKTQVMDNVRVFSSGGAMKIDESVFEGIPESILNPALWPKL